MSKGPKVTVNLKITVKMPSSQNFLYPIEVKCRLGLDLSLNVGSCMISLVAQDFILSSENLTLNIISLTQLLAKILL